MYCTDILDERPLHNLHNAAVLFISSGCKFICLKIIDITTILFFRRCNQLFPREIFCVYHVGIGSWAWVTGENELKSVFLSARDVTRDWLHVLSVYYSFAGHVRIKLSVKSRSSFTHVVIYIYVELFSGHCGGPAEPLTATSPWPSTSTTVAPITLSTATATLQLTHKLFTLVTLGSL